jgi:putative DNA primase/helicase
MSVTEDAIDITAGVEIITPMPEPFEIPDELQHMGEPDGLWIYRMADGGAYGAVARWNSKAKGKRKEIRPIVWDGKRTKASGFGSPRPLYNSDLLAASPLAPVLIVEGEKAADGAQAYVPDGWVVTTWQGGASAWKYSDWDVLQGRACVIWPDNDAAGLRAAAEIEQRLARHDVATGIVTIGPAFGEGWDLGDPLPEKFTASMVTKLLQREIKRVSVKETDAPPGQEIIPVGDPDLDASREWRPLGYDHQTYYVMSESDLQVIPYDSSSLMSERTCMTIHPDRDYWGSIQGTAGKPDWIMSGVMLQGACRKAGIFSMKRIRGRGVWVDKASDGVDRVVLHTGNHLLVKRPDEKPKQISFVRFKSKWIYEKRDALLLDVDDYETQATDDEGRLIREMCQMIRWDSPIYAELLAGWLATAIVCGGLEWRTHCWITGNHGSGKTQVVKRIVGSVLGELAIYPQGATTEAGIRSTLVSDARPVVFDESETDKYAEQRRQAVLGLMRQASSEGRGTIMKGSANHTAHEFAVRSAFMLSSIGVGMKEAADLTRTAVLTVRPLESYSREERGRLEENWTRMLDIEALMPRQMPQRLLARQVANLGPLRANIEAFKKAATEVMNSPRIGDQLGTLLAGSRSLYSTEVLTVAQCRKYIEAQDMSDFMTVRSEREDMALLHHICGSMIRVDTVRGAQDRAIGELIRLVLERPSDAEMDYRDCEMILARYGLRIAYDKREITGLWIGQRVPTLNRIMQTSEYFEGWAGVLMRHPYAKRSPSTLRFGGVVSRAIYIPKQEWPIYEAG